MKRVAILVSGGGSNMVKLVESMTGDHPARPCLVASEAWVFGPNDDNRARLRLALDTVDMDDDTDLVATAALYAAGNMGPGEDLRDHPAPPGALSGCAFGINILSMSGAEDQGARLQLILDRALDIARGGNGKVATRDPAEAPA